MKNIIKGVSIAVVLFLCFKATSKEIPFKGDFNDVFIGESVEYLIIDSVVSDPISLLNHDGFQGGDKDVLNFFVVPNDVWIRFSVKNESSVNSFYVEISQPTLANIELYEVAAGRVIDSVLGGLSKPAKDWTDSYAHIGHESHCPSGETRTFLIKASSGDQLQVPIQLLSKNQFSAKEIDSSLFFGIYAGILLVMIFYNLFIFWSTRDKAYVFYVFYILSVGLTQANYLGFTYPYLYPNFPDLAVFSTYFLGAVVGILAVHFMQIFILTKTRVPKLHNWFRPFLLLYYVAIALALFRFYNLSYQLIQINAGLLACYMIYVASVVSRKGHREAKYFLISWSLFLLGVGVFLAKDYGLLPYNSFTYRSMVFGSAIEVILLSFALADRINQLKKEKESEQVARIQAIQENERIVTEQNIILESKVEVRTKELESSNVELQTTLSDLQSAQSQLVDAEKMASLGQMTAGIAHELNNPINFVSSNVLPLKRDFQDVLEVLEKYEQIDPKGANLKDEFEEIEELKEDVELDYLKEEIHKLLDGIQEGANRTAEIVKGLRVFSRLDEDALKAANLNECIDSTLVILKSSIGLDVKIVKDLDADLPEINCFPGKLNQVFMNIITNGVQATVDPLNKKDEKIVTIATAFNEAHVTISIKDNGIGMPDDVKAKIFDPFFTTKEVGEGTGLGLSIVLGIVNDHQGTMNVESTEGEGTEFLLTLPRSL